MSSLYSRLNCIIWSLLMLFFGYVLGTFFMVVEEVGEQMPIYVLDQDINDRAPIVRVEEIHEGKIVGSVGTGARLIIGDEPVFPSYDGSFAISASSFLTNIIDVPVPRGVLFVASKRGKNYYAVDSSAGQKLTPANRVYFKTANDAEAMGYKRGF